MTILQSDIRLLESERMTDTPDGGGRRTSRVIADGVAGNIFPKISRVDSVYGRINIRHLYGHVNTANVDMYAGAHAIITDAPDNPRIGVLLFPTDLEGAPKTASGRLHMGFAVASFALYYTVADNATPLLAPAAPPALAGVLIALRWLCAWALAALVACLLLPPLRRWFGLAERVFLIAVPAWFAAASLAIAVR